MNKSERANPRVKPRKARLIKKQLTEPKQPTVKVVGGRLIYIR